MEFTTIQGFLLFREIKVKLLSRRNRTDRKRRKSMGKAGTEKLTGPEPEPGISGIREIEGPESVAVLVRRHDLLLLLLLLAQILQETQIIIVFIIR